MKNFIYLLTFIVSNATLAQCFSSLKLQSWHTVAQKPNGTIWVWGVGGASNLNNGGDADESLPIQFATGTDWQFIVAGQGNTFAIKQNGTLWGCGLNQFGALGVGSTNLVIPSLVQVGTASNWRTVAASSDFAVGIKTNNTLWAWGHNNFNQLGDNTITDRLVPVQISSTADWAQIATGKSWFSFALKTNGTLWCWGSDASNVLSECCDGLAVPTQHNPDTDWQKIACGNGHAVAIKTNGTMWAWGSYGQGQTGIDMNNLPPTITPTIPRQMGTDNDWASVTCGNNFSMAIKNNGTLWAWGQGEGGKLGDGGTANRHIPFQIGTDTNWSSVSSGNNATVALKTDGSMWAWGNNMYGQLGNGTTTNIAFPTLIPVNGCVLANEEFEANDELFSILPNPAKNTININSKFNFEMQSISIYNSLGQLVQAINNPKTTVDIDTLQSGNYFVKIVSNDMISSYRFIKE